MWECEGGGREIFWKTPWFRASLDLTFVNPNLAKFPWKHKYSLKRPKNDSRTRKHTNFTVIYRVSYFESKYTCECVVGIKISAARVCTPG